MIPKNEIREVIEECKYAIKENNVYNTAISMSQLVDSENAGLTSAFWREEVNTQAAEKLLSINGKLIETRWLQRFEQLEQMLESSGQLIYEEMVLVLGLRDSLESLPRYMKWDPSDQRKQIDTRFVEILKLNMNMVRESREETVINVERYLPRHWWWRVDLEGFPTESDVAQTESVVAQFQEDGPDSNPRNPSPRDS